MKNLNLKKSICMSILAIAVVLGTMSALYVPKTVSVVTKSSFLPLKSLSCKTLLLGEAGSLVPDTKFHTNTLINESTLSELRQIEAREESLGVAEKDQTQFWLHNNAQGEPIVTKYSVVIYHGLLNSPSWTYWLAEMLYYMGYNVINVRLPKHNNGEREDLNTLRLPDFLNQTSQMVRLSEAIGEGVVNLGHSAGGNSAIHSTLIGNKVAGLISIGPALELRWKSYLPALFLGWTPVSNHFANRRPSPYNRYISIASGRATHAFAKFLKNWGGEGDYWGLVRALSEENFLEIDIRQDETINSDINTVMAYNAGAEYHVFSNVLKHVQMLTNPEELEEGTVQREEMEKILAVILNFLERLD